MGTVIKKWILNLILVYILKTSNFISMDVHINGKWFLGVWFSYWKTLSVFGTTCVCESTSSVVNFMKSKWSCVFDKHLVSELKGAVSVNTQ